MFRFLGNSASLMFQIILVVAGVLIFSYFDPFGILSSSSIKLQNTPISVERMKEIGELITAEYYGEVLASLPEAAHIEHQKMDDVIQEGIEELNLNFIDAITYMRDSLKIKRKNKIYDHFYTEYPNLVSHEFYREYLYYLNDGHKGNYNLKKASKTLSTSKEKGLLRDLVRKKNSSALDAFSNTSSKIGDFIRIQKESYRKEKNKEIKNSRLVLIGRGSVKAGFDFKSSTQNNFLYEEDQGIIHIMGLQPKILDSTINPWFIPEKGVEGFEILMAKGPVRRSPEMMKLVKMRCLNKLTSKAIKSGIFQKAIENAEEGLSSFFSILLAKPIKVFVHSNYLTYIKSSLLDDQLIQDDEILALHNAIQTGLKDTTITETTWTRFVQLIRACEVVITDDSTKLNEYSPFLATFYEIAEDRLFSYAEGKKVDSIFLSVQNFDSASASIFTKLWYKIKGKEAQDIKFLLEQDFINAHQMMENMIIEFKQNPSIEIVGDSASGSTNTPTSPSPLNKINTWRLTEALADNEIKDDEINFVQHIIDEAKDNPEKFNEAFWNQFISQLMDAKLVITGYSTDNDSTKLNKFSPFVAAFYHISENGNLTKTDQAKIVQIKERLEKGKTILFEKKWLEANPSKNIDSLKAIFFKSYFMMQSRIDKIGEDKAVPSLWAKFEKESGLDMVIVPWLGNKEGLRYLKSSILEKTALRDHEILKMHDILQQAFKEVERDSTNERILKECITHLMKCKVIINDIIYSPFSPLSIYFYEMAKNDTLTLEEGRRLGEIIEKSRRKIDSLDSFGEEWVKLDSTINETAPQFFCESFKKLEENTRFIEKEKSKFNIFSKDKTSTVPKNQKNWSKFVIKKQKLDEKAKATKLPCLDE